MRPGVDQPRHVEREDVAEDDDAEDRVEPGLIPAVDGHSRRKVAPEKEHQRNVETALKHHNRVGFQVAQIDGFAFSNDFWVLSDHQPALPKRKAKSLQTHSSQLLLKTTTLH